MNQVSQIEPTIKRSPAIDDLINSALDYQGANTKTVHGRAMLHHIIGNSHDYVVAKDSDNKRIHLNPPDTTKSAYVTESPRHHPLVINTALERLVTHGNTIKDAKELHDHLERMGNSLTRFREHLVNSDMTWIRAREGGNEHEDNNKFIVNVVPKKLQQHLANQIKTYISHPDFIKSDDYYGANTFHKKLSYTSLSPGTPGYSNEHTSDIKNFKNFRHLFSPNAIQHPDVRHDFLNFLDNYEKQSPLHSNVAASLRGSMLNSNGLMGGKERTRYLLKYAENPRSIDLGRYAPATIKVKDENALSYERGKEHPELSNKYYTNEELKNLKRTSKLKIDEAEFQGYIAPKDDIAHQSKFMSLMTIGSPVATTHEELLDFAAHAKRIVGNHPEFAPSRNASGHTIPGSYNNDYQRMHSMHLNALQLTSRQFRPDGNEKHRLQLDDDINHRIQLHMAGRIA